MKLNSFILLCIVLSLCHLQHTHAQSSSPYIEIRSLIQQGEFDKAKDNIDNALKNNLGDAELYFLLGYTHLKLIDEVSVFKKRRHSNDGREALEKAIFLNPQHTKAYKELSDFYFYAPSIVGGNRDKAFQIIDQIQPFDPYHYNILKGDLYANDGKIEMALSYFQNAKEEYPDSLLPLLKVGFYLKESGKFEESISTFRHALKTDSNYYLSYYHIGAAGLEGNIQKEGSIESFHKYIAFSLQNDSLYVEHAWHRIGMLYESQGNRLEAKYSYQKSLEYNSRYSPALNALGKLK